MAAVIAACLPMGILQSVSTQTDYVCAFWLITFVFFLIETQRIPALVNTMAAGLSLGLAFLTKGYSYIFAAPFLIWFMGASFKHRISTGLIRLMLILICALSLNTGQYLRNTQAFGSPMWTHVSLTNESFDLKILWVNALRNVGIHLATPFEGVNENMAQAMAKLAQFFGEDINDPRASFEGKFTIDNNMSRDEDFSGNFFHTVLFAIIFALSWFYRGPKGKISFYVLSVVSSFLLFCLIIRYQPWHSRFHLPLFILFSPVAGAVLDHFLKQKSIVLGVLFFLVSIPWLLANDQHPWFGHRSIWVQPKLAQYFYKKPGLALPVVTISSHLKSIGCQQVGLIMSEDNWEYPWWVFMSGPGVRIEHVQVNNLSAPLKYPLGDFQACALISYEGQPPPFVMVGMSIYEPVGAIHTGEGLFTVFLKKPGIGTP